MTKKLIPDETWEDEAALKKALGEICDSFADMLKELKDEEKKNPEKQQLLLKYDQLRQEELDNDLADKPYTKFFQELYEQNKKDARKKK
jgi:cell shape-determining protein MreC